MQSNKLTPLQEKVQNYLTKHQIEEIMSDMLNTISHYRMDNPFVFMVKLIYY